MRYGLVFAGGGAKGAYEIGVWKALDRMGIGIDAVTGVSIGSVNGAMFVQNDFALAKQLWERITLADIVAIDGADTTNLFSMQNVVTIISEIYKNQGLDTTPLETLLKQIIDEDKIRKSDIKFGLATYSLTDKKAVELFCDQIPEGELVDYILASACLPGFQQRKIDGKTFIDGGVHNNMPINMLLERGYRDIIAVDIGGIGIIKSIVDIGANIVNIKCEDNIIGTMEFEPEAIARSIKRGYYDTYKAFGRLCGETYYFNTSSYYRARSEFSESMMHNLECAGEAFGIEKNAAYNVDAFVRGILQRYAAADELYKKSISDNRNFLDVIAKKGLDNGVIVAWLADMIKNNTDFMSNKLVANLMGTVTEAASAVIYLTEH